MEHSHTFRAHLTCNNCGHTKDALIVFKLQGKQRDIDTKEAKAKYQEALIEQCQDYTITRWEDSEFERVDING